MKPTRKLFCHRQITIYLTYRSIKEILKEDKDPLDDVLLEKTYLSRNSIEAKSADVSTNGFFLHQHFTES